MWRPFHRPFCKCTMPSLSMSDAQHTNPLPPVLTPSGPMSQRIAPLICIGEKTFSSK
jgi:hypothetical protein